MWTPPLKFIGSHGAFPAPENNMTLTASLHEENALRRALKIKDFADKGSISHKEELESIIDKFSPTQTSIFGRVGRAMFTSIYQKINTAFYNQSLSGRELSTFRWRATSMLRISPRPTRSRWRNTDLNIYTGEATKTRIGDAVIIGPATFTND